MKEATYFKVGETVHYWDAPSKWWIATTVTAIKDGKVWVDTNFGDVPFDPNELEFDDVPF